MIASLEHLRATVRERAFATPGLARAVRAQRAHALESAYSRQCARYRACIGTTAELLRARAGSRLASLPARPRVLYVGADPLQDHSGLLAGLDAVAELVPFTQPDGRYGQLDPDGNLSFALCRPNASRLLDLLADAEARGRPFHLVVGQMWAGYTDRRALAKARERFGVVVVNIAMDDRHAFVARKLGRRIGTRDLAPALDLAATAAPEAVGWYHAIGCPATFFPEASDPELFRPRPELEKTHDVCFVGWRYGIRERLVERLRRAGISVDTRGAGWPEGRIRVPDVPLLFARSRIVLGVGTIGQSDRLVALKLRDFDGPMSGSCYVTQWNPDLARLFEVGSEIAVYRSEEECVEVVGELLGDNMRREAIAARGRKRALREHTWEHRFRELLRILRQAGAVAPEPEEVA